MSGMKSHSVEEWINEILILKNEYGLKRITKENLMSNVKGLAQRESELLLAFLELCKKTYSDVPSVGWGIKSP